MKPAQKQNHASRKQWQLLVGLLALSAFFYGCTTAIRVESNPPGATVTVNGQSIGTTPVQYQMQGSKPLDVQATMTGYFPEYLSYTPDSQSGTDKAPISLNLERSQIDKSYEVVTEPAGVSLMLDGRSVGITPITVPVTYTRSGKKDPWAAKTLELSKTNYQSER
ncbi:MAG TPA: PEGA domain-containing protein, partial [Opitutaceae bacterium]|nr:PEGA domain-containing protein [Opitutaceae bacterium]